MNDKTIRVIAVLAWTLNHFGRGKDSRPFLFDVQRVENYIKTGRPDD